MEHIGKDICIKSNSSCGARVALYRSIDKYLHLMRHITFVTFQAIALDSKCLKSQA